MAKKKYNVNAASVPADESKSDRFIRVVTPRVNKAIKAIDVIGYCNGSTYEHTEQQVKQICELLHITVDKLQLKFSGKGDGAGLFQLT